MKTRKHLEAAGMECSFCHKSQAVVRRLVSNPSDFRTRVYICDECITLCTYILEDDTDRFAHDPVDIDSHKRPAVLDNPLTLPFLRCVERWIKLESSGADCVTEFEGLRSAAVRLFAPEA